MSFEFTNWPVNVQNDAQHRINGQIMHNTESSTFEGTSQQRLYCAKILKQSCYPSISLRQLCQLQCPQITLLRIELITQFWSAWGGWGSRLDRKVKHVCDLNFWIVHVNFLYLNWVPNNSCQKISFCFVFVKLGLSIFIDLLGCHFGDIL